MNQPADDLPRDAHLRAALRHAPDAAVQPPAHLTAQIIAAAHRAATAAPAPPPRAVRRWGWLPGAWPQGALATVCLAGLIGLLWRGEMPGPEVQERGVAPAPAALEPASAAPAASSIAPAAAAAAEARLPASLSPPAPRQAGPLPALSRAKLSEGVRAKTLADVPAVAAIAPAAAPAPAAADRAEMPSLSLAPAPAPAQEAPRAAPAATRAVPPPALRSAATPAASASTRWRIDGEDRGPAPSAWLRALAQADAQHGQPSAQQSLDAARRVDLLLPDGQVASSLWISDDTLLWCRPEGCRRSALDADLSAQLLQALGRRIEPQR